MLAALKFIFIAVSGLTSLICSLIFTFIVPALQLCQVPGQAMHQGLNHFASFIKSCLEYLLELMFEIICSLLFTTFDQLKEGVWGSASAFGSAMGGLAEKMRDSLSGLLDNFPVLFEGLWEMASTMVTNVLNICIDVLRHVKENA